MSDVTIEVQTRETTGKNANRRLRATGQIPAVIYGGGKDPVAIQVDERNFAELLKSEGGENAVFLLQLAGTDQSRHTMIREMQHNSVTDHLLHVDFQRILLDQKVRVTVSIEILGEAVGVKTESGLLDFVTRELEVECLPKKIPTRLEIDVSELHVGQHLEAGAVELPEGVALHAEPTKVIVSVASPRGGAEAGEEEEDLLERATAEPEVVKHGKGEDE